MLHAYIFFLSFVITYLIRPSSMYTSAKNDRSSLTTRPPLINSPSVCGEQSWSKRERARERGGSCHFHFKANFMTRDTIQVMNRMWL